MHSPVLFLLIVFQLGATTGTASLLLDLTNETCKSHQMEAPGKAFWREGTDTTRKAAFLPDRSDSWSSCSHSVTLELQKKWNPFAKYRHKRGWFPDDFILRVACPPPDRYLLQERLNLKVKSLLLTIFYQLPNTVPNRSW